jgi:phenylpropionate dioxygenase-like ring-hydroxylating dioxygenase large terminal subunit
MQQSAQIEVAHQLLDYIDTRTTAMADDIYRQPVREYTCPERAAREHATLFRALPLCLGLSGLLPERGSYATHEVSGLPLVLTRAEDGEVRALLNVCRHRGARVAEGCGTTRAFACPYHAWTYGLDGRLASRPEDAAFAGAPRTQHGLTPLPTTERDGLIWALPVPGGTLDLDAHLLGFGEELAGFDLGRFHLYASRVIERRMNWKLLLDTFLESYHFCVLHKDSICSIFHQNLSTFDAWGPHFRLINPRRSIAEMRALPAREWNLLPHMVGLYVLFPNTVLVWQLDHVELWQIFPGPSAPEDSVVLLSLYTPEPALTESARRHWDKNLDLVLHVVENEDFPLGEGVQRGLHTPAQQHIVFGRNEPGLAHFHRSVTAMVGAAAPRAGGA